MTHRLNEDKVIRVYIPQTVRTGIIHDQEPSGVSAPAADDVPQRHDRHQISRRVAHGNHLGLAGCGQLLSPNRVSNRARPVAVRSDELARSAPGDGRRGLVSMRR